LFSRLRARAAALVHRLEAPVESNDRDRPVAFWGLISTPTHLAVIAALEQSEFEGVENAELPDHYFTPEQIAEIQHAKELVDAMTESEYAALQDVRYKSSLLPKWTAGYDADREHQRWRALELECYWFRKPLPPEILSQLSPEEQAAATAAHEATERYEHYWRANQERRSAGQ
jgi:hypothetical protein